MRQFLRRTPFVFKVVVLTMLSGILVGIVTDFYTIRVVEKIFRQHLQQMLEQQSQEDRLRFDQYLQGFHQTARVAVEYRPFLDHIKVSILNAAVGETPPLVHEGIPAWFMPRQVMNHLATPRYIMLFDEKGRVKEIYSRRQAAPLPEFFKNPSSLLVEKSRNQAHIYSKNGRPFAMTAEDIFFNGVRKATLILISPIDSEFLIATQKDMPSRLIGLVDVERNTLMSSNNEILLPSQVSLNTLKKDFVITGREYHDYGGAEVAIRLSSFVPKKEIAVMGRKFIMNERKERIFANIISFLIFILITLWITRKIKTLTRKVEAFSQKALGGENPDLPPGDQIDILNERFEILTGQIIASQKRIIEQADLEAVRKIELETSSRQLILLEMIMKSLGFGVLVKRRGEYYAINDKMFSYLEKCPDISDFIVEPPETTQRFIKDKNGNEMVFQLTGLDLFDDNRVVVVSDITEALEAEQEKIQLQESLYQATKMESIGRLAGGVAHDFNNLLTAILGYAQLGIMKSPATDPLKTHFENIFEAGKRASDLTQQLLSFSRKQKINLQVINLNNILGNLQKMFTRLIGENIEIILNRGPALWNIRADRTQIEQLLMNLAINAKDAMPEGGVLMFTTKNFVSEGHTSDGQALLRSGKFVQLEVKDTGTGISPENQDHIFEPFFTTKDIGKGTGLGLATVYGIVKQNNGSIFVRSEAGKGCRFDIYIPSYDLAGDYAQQDFDQVSEDMPAGGESILLVEDEERVRDLIQSVLSSLGYTVRTANSSNEAFKLLKEMDEKFDLLFTDIVMPGMDGIELANAVSQINPYLKIIFMTGYSDKDISRTLGINSRTNLLYKPLTPTTIAQKVREVLDQ